MLQIFLFCFAVLSCSFLFLFNYGENRLENYLPKKAADYSYRILIEINFYLNTKRTLFLDFFFKQNKNMYFFMF
jgi:hypothetical protein